MQQKQVTKYIMIRFSRWGISNKTALHYLKIDSKINRLDRLYLYNNLYHVIRK